MLEKSSNLYTCRACSRLAISLIDGAMVVFAVLVSGAVSLLTGNGIVLHMLVPLVGCFVYCFCGKVKWVYKM